MEIGQNLNGADSGGINPAVSAGQGDAGEWMRELAREQGLPLPPEHDRAPHVFMGPNLHASAVAIASVLARLDLFSLNGGLVTPNDSAGRFDPMTPRRFRTWLNLHMLVARKTSRDSGELIADTLTLDEAATILETDEVKRAVREVVAFNRERLPVIRPDGTLAPLPLGYDSETKTYTCRNAIDYDRSISIESAKVALDRIDAGFPFSDARSRAVQRAAQLALFVKHLPGGQSLRPGFLWLANKPGCGKSVLAKAALYPVLGYAAVAKMKRGDDLDKELEAFARANVPVIFLDNVYGGLASASIDQMLTSKHGTGRAMGGHDTFLARFGALLFVTGNRLELNEDAGRRFLVVDLFDAGDPAERSVTTRLDDDVMEAPEWRGKVLSWLWAMVAAWHAQGMPKAKCRLATYEVFSELLGGIVVAAGYEEPFRVVYVPGTISPDKREMAELVDLIVEEMAGDAKRDMLVQDIVRLARAGGLFESKVGTQEEGRRLTIKKDGLKGDLAALAQDLGYMEQGHTRAFGSFLAANAGDCPRGMKTGKRLQFGKREQARKSTYTVEVLAD